MPETDRVERSVRAAVEVALDKKAFDLVVLKVGEVSSIADYFVICSTGSERQSLAVTEGIEQSLRETIGIKPLLVEGRRPGRWVLLDYGDFVVHVFTEETRGFYRLERLWDDAPDETKRFEDDGSIASAASES
jgi:ribosome-associated protein